MVQLLLLHGTLIPFTFLSRRAGSIPKNGLIGMAGFISAPTSDGRGVIAIPPVSIWVLKHQNKNTVKIVIIWIQFCFFMGKKRGEGGLVAHSNKIPAKIRFVK